MIPTIPLRQKTAQPLWLGKRVLMGAVMGMAVLAAPARAVDLADQPLFSTVNVPGNLILALSVEWPTATTPAYDSTKPYSANSTYLGYFDPDKCYKYKVVKAGTKAVPDYSGSYFDPSSTTSNHACSGKWSGNYLNWAAMQTLDAFRWVMTGGYRSTDTKSSTILTKTYAAQNSASVIPNKTVSGAATISGATPLGWSDLNTRLRAIGTAMYFSKSGNIDDDLASVVDYTNQSSPDESTVYRVYINVKVCDKGVGLEANCVKYPSEYAKPEGLMQQYSSRLRYSAFGYYNHSGTNTFQRDGGVMRARMKYIGPTQPVPGSTAIENGLNEWDPETGIMAVNPDADDASATVGFASKAGYKVTIENSGVMNYLNKFGYFAKSYKSKDPVSELYYAALRYYKKLDNIDSYTSLATAGSAATAANWLDGFPAITSWDDPILYSCQKNFVLGIGDVNTHRDANLYGSTLRSSSKLDNINDAITDASVNVGDATNMVGQLEGYKGSLADIFAATSNSACADDYKQCNSYYVAGLAYDAHTVDMRSDLAGDQLVNTYFMDVLENQVYKHKNQYWLAAKYGGFKVPSGFSPYSSSNGPSSLADKDWSTTSDTLNVGTLGLTYGTDDTNWYGKKDKRPDNYFPGNRPDLMKSGLTSAFEKIVSETDSAASTALSTVSPDVTSAGAVSYAAAYDPATWTGEVAAYKVVYDADGKPTATQKWNARDLLSDTSVTAATRKIVTCCKRDGSALPFTYASLSTASLIDRTDIASFSKVLGVSASDQSAEDFIAFLRGDTSKEVANGGPYRTRAFRLGDIVNAKPVAVGAPDFPYFDFYNPGYSDFKSLYSGRDTVVYAGSNDGMLHAFDGSIDEKKSGQELFAYVPSFVYGDKDTGPTTGLAALGNPSYSHRYLVDASPAYFDVDFSKTHESKLEDRDWHTLLIGGMGKGGKGYYAIDVTDPSQWTTENAVAGKVLWEFTDSRMGHTYGRPSVVKTEKYGWVVIFTSGYNNTDGVGYFFLVNPANGELLEAVATPEGSVDAPINLGEHTAYVSKYADMTTDAVYAGDLEGHLWRLDLTGKAAYEEPEIIATLLNKDKVAQPVTTRPLVEIDPSTSKRYVLIGTGKLLADSDISSGDVQSIYAIVDGTYEHGAFYDSSSLPAGVTFPVTRDVLEENEDLVKGIGTSPTAVMGWYFDLPVTEEIAYRVNVTPTANRGIAAFVANWPNGDACSPGGVGSVYAFKFGDGQTVLEGDDGALVAALAPTGGVLTDVAIQNVGGRLRMLVGGPDANGDPSLENVRAKLGGAGAFMQLNWQKVATPE